MTSIWYFGYGSNMKTSVMTSRGICPLDVAIVRVPGYTLTFDVFGIPYSEPSMASIAPFTKVDKNPTTPDVCGIAYLLSADDFIRVIGTEGGGVAYREITLQATVLGSNMVDRDSADCEITVHTLVAKLAWRPNACPSARYLNLLREGARDQDLPQGYQNYLASLTPYSPSGGFWHNLGASIFLFPAQYVVRRLARRVKGSLDTHGRCPAYWSSITVATFSAMWIWHDWVHSRVFGRGDGGKMQYSGVRLI